MKNEEPGPSDCDLTSATGRLERLEILASGVAHDLNNVLSSMRAGVYMLETDVGDSASAKAVLAYLDEAIEYSSGLCRSVLAHAAGSVTTRVLELVELIGDMQPLFRGHLPSATSVRIVPRVERLYVHADATQVSQILFNLVTNAADALGRPGGEVTVTLDRGVSMPADLVVSEPARARLQQGHAIVRVEDSGCGMTGDAQGRMFAVHRTTKEHGHGLGLSLVAALVHRHGGALRIQSVPNAGTCVEVLLPLIASA